MQNKILTEQEKGLIRQCITTLTDSQLIEDWEFQTRLGITRDELARSAASLGEGADISVDDICGFGNCINELANAFGIEEVQRETGVSLVREELLSLIQKFRNILQNLS